MKSGKKNTSQYLQRKLLNTIVTEKNKEQEIAILSEELREKNKLLELMQQVLKKIKEIQDKLERLRKKEKEKI